MPACRTMRWHDTLRALPPNHPQMGANGNAMRSFRTLRILRSFRVLRVLKASCSGDRRLAGGSQSNAVAAQTGSVL